MPSQAWLVTFTDLTALLLAFFVLLFSMSEVRRSAWEAVIEALSDRLSPVPEEREDAPQADKSVSKKSVPNSSDLDYLRAVVADKIRTDAVLAGAILQRLDDRLVISLPSGALFEPGSARLTADAGGALVILADVLEVVDNSVDIHGHTDPDPISTATFASNWELSLERAIAVGAALRDAGLTREVSTFGLAGSRFQELSRGVDEERRYEMARRVDVVIRATVEESSLSAR